MSDSGEINELISAMKAEIATLKNSVRGIMANQNTGLDSVEFGMDDDCLPNVPIGGKEENFEMIGSKDRRIKSGWVIVGRNMIYAEGIDANETGSYQVKVIFGESSDKAEIVRNESYQANTDDETYLPLYTVLEDGSVVDERVTFRVQCWEY